MGYRLNIKCKDISFYGTKHYGYAFEYLEDGMKYPSVKYLASIGKTENYDAFLYGLENKITLTAVQFRKWIKLYAKEWEKLKVSFQDWPAGRTLLGESKIKEMLEANERKVIWWD